MFYIDKGRDRHVTAPTPYFGPNAVAHAMSRLELLHPGAVIDELMPEDIADALTHTF